MSKRLTLAEFLASIDRLEADFDRSMQTIERCIEHLSVIEERMRQDHLARSQTNSQEGIPSAALRNPGRRLQGT